MCNSSFPAVLGLITEPLQATASNFQSTWVHATCGFVPVLRFHTGHICILNALGTQVNP